MLLRLTSKRLGKTFYLTNERQYSIRIIEKYVDPNKRKKSCSKSAATLSAITAMKIENAFTRFTKFSIFANNIFFIETKNFSQRFETRRTCLL